MNGQITDGFKRYHAGHLDSWNPGVFVVCRGTDFLSGQEGVWRKRMEYIAEPNAFIRMCPVRRFKKVNKHRKHQLWVSWKDFLAYADPGGK